MKAVTSAQQSLAPSVTPGRLRESQLDLPHGQSSSLPAPLSAFIQSCSAHPHSWLRDKPGITPSLISKEPRPGQTWLFWLRKDRGTCPSTPTLCTPQLWESRAKSPRIRSLWFLPLPSATATFHRQPRTPAPQWGPSSSHSLQVKTLGYLLNAI